MEGGTSRAPVDVAVNCRDCWRPAAPVNIAQEMMCCISWTTSGFHYVALENTRFTNSMLLMRRTHIVIFMPHIQIRHVKSAKWPTSCWVYEMTPRGTFVHPIILYMPTKCHTCKWNHNEGLPFSRFVGDALELFPHNQKTRHPKIKHFSTVLTIFKKRNQLLVNIKAFTMQTFSAQYKVKIKNFNRSMSVLGPLKHCNRTKMHLAFFLCKSLTISLM